MTQSFSLVTLVDISNTKVIDSRFTNTIKYNQYQNLHTVLQIIAMRCQPLNYSVVELSPRIPKSLGLGNNIKGKHKLWRLEFETDRSSPWINNTDELYYLKQDFNGMVFIDNLSNTYDFANGPFFVTEGPLTNIAFQTGIDK